MKIDIDQNPFDNHFGTLLFKSSLQCKFDKVVASPQVRMLPFCFLQCSPIQIQSRIKDASLQFNSMDRENTESQSLWNTAN